MSIQIVIGKNFGDEGKGLATDYFSGKAQKQDRSCLVIRHNGGAQAGHTVDLPEKRFVFHQLSSGSFRNADTFWADTFMPDLYKLPEEIADFSALHGTIPKIYGHGNCRCVSIDDVLINMALETSRGEKRHGSCGMGINEAVERSKDGVFGITLKQLCMMTARELYCRLSEIRKEYVSVRMAQLNLQFGQIGEYGELLKNENVLYNAAETMSRAASLLTISEGTIVNAYDEIVFEGAQGLLLDETFEVFAPYLTSSRTGLYNPMKFMKKYLQKEKAEIVYVSRAYVTRHGAGPLPYEELWDKRNMTDQTNVYNPWQGNLRFAPHGTVKEFLEPVQNDLLWNTSEHRVSLMVTHLNETKGSVCSTVDEIAVQEWCNHEMIREVFEKCYLSGSPYAEDIYQMSAR